MPIKAMLIMLFTVTATSTGWTLFVYTKQGSALDGVGMLGMALCMWAAALVIKHCLEEI